MRNSFAIRGLRDETAHEQRDVDIRQTRVGERPDKNEVVETKTLKSAESYKDPSLLHAASLKVLKRHQNKLPITPFPKLQPAVLQCTSWKSCTVGTQWRVDDVSAAVT